LKIYLVPAQFAIDHFKIILNNVKNMIVSYVLFRTPDRRNVYQKSWAMVKSEKIEEKIRDVLTKFDSIIIDSGAFSYMSGTIKSKEKLLDKYVIEYGNWLKENKDIYEYFFEMDVDFLVGIKKVEEYRKFLEECAEQQCIPVWHINRGLEYWKMMVKDYDYVAIGGLVTGEITDMEKYAPFLIDIAHKNNCKVHGLGYTKTKYLKYIDFDSVDSSSWFGGRRYGNLDIFLDGDLKPINLDKIDKNSRIPYKDFDIINIKAWKLFIDYIEDYWNRQKEEEKLQSKSDTK